MKRFLPILTLALLGAAVTAFADDEDSRASYYNYYYDYYLPANVTLTPAAGSRGNNNSVILNEGTEAEKRFENWNDSVTYKTMTSTQSLNGTVQMSDATYTIHRESNWGTELRGADPNNYFRIEIGENEKNETVNLYLTDYVSSIYDDKDTYYHSDTGNALFQRGIVEYGYRVLEQDNTGKYKVVGEEHFTALDVSDKENGKVNFTTTVSDGENEQTVTKYYTLNETNVTPQDTIEVGYNKRPVTRYKYDLGEFKPGQVIELYMKDYLGEEVYSFSSDLNGVYTPFDSSTPVLDSTTGEPITATQGGFGDAYVATSIQTDDMLYRYYFTPASEHVNDYKDYITTAELEASSDPIKLGTKRAMPLSQLIPGSNALATVSFGLFGVATGKPAFGTPLPGGFQMALIAGLFGLGFCYVRRRKAIVG